MSCWSHKCTSIKQLHFHHTGMACHLFPCTYINHNHKSEEKVAKATVNDRRVLTHVTPTPNTVSRIGKKHHRTK